MKPDKVLPVLPMRSHPRYNRKTGIEKRVPMSIFKERGMLEKDNCLMFKALVGLVQSQSYQIGSLFAMIEVMLGDNLSEESRRAFRKAMSNLEDNAARIQAALDQIMENGDVDPERVITDLPKTFN